MSLLLQRVLLSFFFFDFLCSGLLFANFSLFSFQFSVRIAGLEHHQSLANKDREENVFRITKLEKQLAQSMRRSTQLQTKLSLTQADLDIERAIRIKAEFDLISKEFQDKAITMF